MKKRKNVCRILAAEMLAATLLASPVQADGAARLSSYKGTTLQAGERSMLLTEHIGTECVAISSNPEVVDVEKVLQYWVAVAKSDGTATITVMNGSGAASSITLTVAGRILEPPTGSDPAIDLAANMEIRQEIVRLVNQVRRENGVAEVPVNTCIMNAAQDITTHRLRWHDIYEWEAMAAYGWPYGGGNNHTSFSIAPGQDIAKTAVSNWVNSSPHFQSMIRDTADCLGVGVTIANDVAYCHLFMGDSNAYGPL